MEKVILPLWKQDGISAEEFRRQLLDEFSAILLKDSTVISLKMCVVDEHVKAADPYRMVNLLSPAQDAVLIAWLHAADEIFAHRDSIEKYCANYYVYVVTESDRLPLDYSDMPSGYRTEGMNEIVALQVPDWLSREQWLKIWLESHTRIAIDTQSTYGYRQNVVVRALTPDAPVIDAFVEENFPEKAIHSRMDFYDASDEATYRQREKTMIESVARFIDFEKIDCIPTSEYIMK